MLFTGSWKNLPREDKLKLKAVFDRYGKTGEDVGRLLTRLVENRRKQENSFLKSEDQDDFNGFHFTRSNGKQQYQQYQQYPAHMTAGLIAWDKRGRPTFAGEAQLRIKEALKLIKKGTGEPEVLPPAPRKKLISNKTIHEKAVTRFQEGRNMVVDTMNETRDEVLEEIFDGKFPVKLFHAINGEDLVDVQTKFNVSSPTPKIDPSFHGFMITSGAEIFAEELVKDYSVNRNLPWSFFIIMLHRYGFREDVCNVGTRLDFGGSYNNHTFIFYHEHFHSEGLEEVKKMVQKTEKVFKEN